MDKLSQGGRRNVPANIKFEKTTKKGSSKKKELELTNFEKPKPKENSYGYMEEFVSSTPQETIENFKKVKKIIDEESNIVKKKKKKSKKRKKKNIIIITILIVILILLIATFVCMLTVPIFNLKNVDIYGTDRYSSEDVQKCINLNYDENIFIAMFKSNKSNTKNEFPYIDSIKYKVKIPNTINMQVVERKARYYAFNKEDSKYYLITQDGYIIDCYNDSSNWKDEILISGITFENKVTLGDKINDIDMSKIVKFESFYDSLLLNIDEVKVTRVTFKNEYMYIYINSLVEVVFEVDKNLEDYNISLLKLILKDVEGLSGVIDMTKDNPTFVRKQ